MAAAALLCSCTAEKRDTFVVRADMPGMQDSVRVQLCNAEKREGQEGYVIADGVAANGKVELTGKAEHPILCMLSIDMMREKDLGPKEYMKTSGIKFMLENAEYDISAAHIDSVPLSYEFGTSPLFKEKNVSIKTNSTEQKQYAAYREATDPYELACFYNWKEHYRSGKPLSPEDDKRLSKESDVLKARLDSANKAYIAAHSGETMAVILGTQYVDGVFQFSEDGLDAFIQQVGMVADSARMDAFIQKAEKARKYTLGKAFVDFNVTDETGKTYTLSQLFSVDKPVLVDLWASWCGPCRMAIPEVRELYAKYGDKLQVISASVDKKEEDWKQAVAEEAMEWTQVIVPMDQTELLRDEYGLQYIPFLFVIHNNKIVAYGEPAELDKALAEIIK